MRCVCGQILEFQDVEELEGNHCLFRFVCSPCDVHVGVEAEAQEAASVVDQVVWTDEAQHVLDRLPPYVESLVREEVLQYAREKNVHLMTVAFLTEARNEGVVPWNPEAESRLEKVPAAVRGIARLELERTALERGLSEVSVSLMEEVKARYFGMRAQAT